MKDIKTAKEQIRYRLEVLIGEMLEQYALYENKHFAMLLYNRAVGLHCACKITDYSAFNLLDYIWIEVHKRQADKVPAFEAFNASAFVEEMEDLADKFLDMDE